MGATNARIADAEFQLAVPKHTTVLSRRILDVAVHRCPICEGFFGIGKRKHYCRRCGCICCENCTSLRRYKVGQGEGTKFRVCNTCNNRPSILELSRKLWELILSFCDDIEMRQMFLLCHASQLGIPLPYIFGESWDSFFTEGTLIATGANGSVFKTMLKEGSPHFRYHRAPVAVKVIKKREIYSIKKWHNLQREIDSLRICRHPNVVELITVFQTPTEVYVVQQIAGGGDLFDWVVSKKSVSEAEVIPIAKQLLQTLAYMHDSCGVVHRDIKPENILLEHPVKLNKVPHILLADFGYARIFSETKKNFVKEISEIPYSLNKINNNSNDINKSLNKNSVSSNISVIITSNKNLDVQDDISIPATPCGTLGFAAPEIILAYSKLNKSNSSINITNNDNKINNITSINSSKCVSNSIDKVPPPPRETRPITSTELMKKMDIFAAGVTLCILLTGYEPFPSNSPKVHLEAVRSGVNLDGRQWLHVSLGAKLLLRRMLAPNASDRPTALECLRSPYFSNNSKNGRS